MLASTPLATSESPEQRLLLEQAKAFLAELHRVANAAPNGQMLRIAERLRLRLHRRPAIAQSFRRLEPRPVGFKRTGHSTRQHHDGFNLVTEG